MKKRVLKEMLIFSAIALLLSIAVHPDLLSVPLARFTHMNERGNIFHPLVYTTIVYTLFLILRTISTLIKNIFSLKK